MTINSRKNIKKREISIHHKMDVPFYDVDSYRIVWHGNYPKYFEVARCLLLGEIGYSYQKMEQAGYFFPITGLEIKYLKPLVFEQKVVIQATLKEWKNKLVINYLITNQLTGEELTKGQTSQVAVFMPDEMTQFESPAGLIKQVELALDKQEKAD